MFSFRLIIFAPMISQAIFLFIGMTEIAFILFVVLLVFGADKVPEIARSMGKIIRQVKNATEDIKSEITKSAQKEGIDIDITKDVQKEIDKVKDDIDEITGSVKRNL